jgi:hypothetical protein
VLLDHDPFISASQVAGIAGVSLRTRPLGLLKEKIGHVPVSQVIENIVQWVLGVHREVIFNMSK